MKAIRIHRYGDFNVCEYEDAPEPEIGPSEVLIKVHSAAVNPVDCKIRQGHRKDYMLHRFPFIPGCDVAGTVERAGAQVACFKHGDPVFSTVNSTRNGTYAEYVAVRADEIALAPASIPLHHAAGIPLAASTAWTALFADAHLDPRHSILIHAASGGVGSFAVQLAKYHGARVIATTSGPNVPLIRSLGADEVIDYRSEDFDTKVKDVNVVLDTLGGETQQRSWKVLRENGVLVSLAGTADESTAKRHGVTAKAVQGRAGGSRLNQIARIVDAGKLKVVIDREFPLAAAGAAHARSETGHACGKIILRVI
jgi:NADPH:quinone reductase-like Zn-dependent oxidoreductase